MGELVRIFIVGSLVFGTGGTPDAQNRSQAVRPEGTDAARLVAEGTRRSRTFRELTEKLGLGDVIVYVRFARCVGGVPSCLLFASAEPGGPRRLLVKLDRFGRSEPELIALLAHELQHACEVVSDQQIVDIESFQRAFQQRGWKGSAGFETVHAKEITRRVAVEITSRQ